MHQQFTGVVEHAAQLENNRTCASHTRPPNQFLISPQQQPEHARCNNSFHKSPTIRKKGRGQIRPELPEIRLKHCNFGQTGLTRPPTPDLQSKFLCSRRSRYLIKSRFRRQKTMMQDSAGSGGFGIFSGNKLFADRTAMFRHVPAGIRKVPRTNSPVSS